MALVESEVRENVGILTMNVIEVHQKINQIPIFNARHIKGNKLFFHGNVINKLYIDALCLAERKSQAKNIWIFSID